MRFKVANYSRLEIRLDTLHIYSRADWSFLADSEALLWRNSNVTVVATFTTRHKTLMAMNQVKTSMELSVVDDVLALLYS